MGEYYFLTIDVSMVVLRRVCVKLTFTAFCCECPGCKPAIKEVFDHPFESITGCQTERKGELLSRMSHDWTT